MIGEETQVHEYQDLMITGAHPIQDQTRAVAQDPLEAQKNSYPQRPLACAGAVEVTLATIPTLIGCHTVQQ